MADARHVPRLDVGRMALEVVEELVGFEQQVHPHRQLRVVEESGVEGMCRQPLPEPNRSRAVEQAPKANDLVRREDGVGAVADSVDHPLAERNQGAIRDGVHALAAERAVAGIVADLGGEAQRGDGAVEDRVLRILGKVEGVGGVHAFHSLAAPSERPLMR